MNQDQMLREAKNNVNHIFSMLGYLPESTEVIKRQIELAESSQYKQRAVNNNLGFVFPLLGAASWAWMGLTAAIGYVTYVWQKSWTDRMKYERDIAAMNKGLDPATFCDTGTPTTIDKIIGTVKGFVLLAGGAITLYTAYKLVTKKK